MWLIELKEVVRVERCFWSNVIVSKEKTVIGQSVSQLTKDMSKKEYSRKKIMLRRRMSVNMLKR